MKIKIIKTTIAVIIVLLTMAVSKTTKPYPDNNKKIHPGSSGYFEQEDIYNSQNDFTFDMILTVDKEYKQFYSSKLPRTGVDGETILGIILSVLLGFVIYIIKLKVGKENKKINESIK